MNSIVCCVCVGYSVALNFNVSAVATLYTLHKMPVWAMSFYIVVWPEYYFSFYNWRNVKTAGGLCM